MTLYGAAKAPGGPLREAGTTVVALTDSSGGSASETLAAMTNTAALTNSIGGTAADVLAVATNIATVADSTGGSAGNGITDIPDGGSGVSGGGWSSSGDRDTAITNINNNFKDLIVANIAQKTFNTSVINTTTTFGRELILQRAANVVLLNHVASLADKLSDLITHLNDGR